MSVSPGGNLQTTAGDDDLATRKRRANSWCERGAREHDADEDGAFIFYWIAFDASYNKDLPRQRPAEKQFKDYFERLTHVDEKELLESTLQDELAASVSDVLDNKYLYQPYWDYLNGKRADWQNAFQQCNARAKDAKNDTATRLHLLFKRLYTLRNQLLHGAATRKSTRNRDSVEHGARILKFLVPMFIKLMSDNPQEDWGPTWHPPGLRGKPRRQHTGNPHKTR